LPYGARQLQGAAGLFQDKVLKNGAPLTIMNGGEHWFHTAEQMAFLDKWIRTEAL
jgi:hypothetical protein